MSIIIERFCNITIITHEASDYILIEDIIKEYEDILTENPYIERSIKSIIFKYLKKIVKIEKYSSKVFGKFNKRGYIGVKWKDINKNKKYTNKKGKHYHFYEHYNLKKLLENKEESNKFLNEINSLMCDINWPPINIIFYINVLINNLKNELKNNDIKKDIIVDFKNKNKEKSNIIVNNNINKGDFYDFLNKNLIITEDKKDIIFTEEIIKTYNTNLNIEADGLLKKEVRSFILEKFCNNDINILNKKYLYRKEKRGYKYIKLLINT